MGLDGARDVGEARSRVRWHALALALIGFVAGKGCCPTGGGCSCSCSAMCGACSAGGSGCSAGGSGCGYAAAGASGCLPIAAGAAAGCGSGGGGSSGSGGSSGGDGGMGGCSLGGGGGSSTGTNMRTTGGHSLGSFVSFADAACDATCDAIAPADAAMDAGDDAAPACIDDAIYLVSDERARDVGEPPHLWRFDPLTLLFTDLGAISCATSATIIFGITVDRSGEAWLVASGDYPHELWDVHTADATCRSNTPLSGRSPATDTTPVTIADTIGGGLYAEYVESPPPWQLVLVDRTTAITYRVGTFDPSLGTTGAFLQGTADSLLLSFETRVGDAGLLEIDVVNRSRTTAMGSLTGTISVSDSRRVAGVVQWGGEDWIFLAGGAGQTSAVATWSGMPPSFAITLPDVGFTPWVVGTSTCAPLESPL